MRILLVDDDRVTLRVLQALVEQEGHEAVCAADGDEGWQRFTAQRWQVTIIDWEMPGLDGLELLRRIRAAPGPGYTYVILVSARGETTDVLEGMDAGADDFLIKPIRRTELRARLRVADRIVGLQDTLANQYRELEAANLRFTRDLAAAQRAQRALLPERRPRLPGIDVAWRLDPCDELAGDILNVFPLGAGHVGFYVLDVSGHGVASALLAVQAGRFIDPRLGGSALLQPVEDGPPARPLAVACELNRLFPASRRSQQYFTLLYGVWDLAQGQVELVSAGHPAPVVLRADGRAEQPDLHGHPIGLFPQDTAQFGALTLAMARGDRLWLYSDGIPETVDGKERPFDVSGLVRALQGARGGDLESAVQQAFDALARHRAGQPVADDLTLMGLAMA